MLFKDTYHLIGIDIRAKNILAVELAGSGKGCRLKRIGQAKLPKTVAGEAERDDPAVISEALTTLYREKKFGSRYVALAVSGVGVIVKNLLVKREAPAVLHNRILRMAEQYVPYAIDSMYMDYTVLGNSVNQPGQMDLLVVAAPKALVEKQVKAARMADLFPVVVDVAPLAVTNCYSFNNDDTTPVILLGVDEKSVAVSVVEAGMLRFTRYVEIEPSIHPDGAELANVYYDAMGRFLELDITREIETVYLYGNRPQLTRFINEFIKEVDVEVKLLDPFGHIKTPSKRMTLDEESLAGPQAAISVGLALRPGGMP